MTPSQASTTGRFAPAVYGYAPTMATSDDTSTDASARSTSDEAPTAATTADRDASREEPVREYRGTGIIWSAVALLAAIVAIVVVVIQNTHDVEFDFLWFDVSMPLSLILAITFGLALVLGEVTGFVWRRRRRTRLRERDELRRLRARS